MDKEKLIIRTILKEAVRLDYLVTIDDGEDKPVRKSKCIPCIMDHVGSTDEQSLLFYKRRTPGETGTAYKKVGSVSLVFGNCPWEVIQSWSDNSETEHILRKARELCDTYEASA